MELSKKAIEFAYKACQDGNIIEGTPVQLEMLARNAQALIDEYELILMRHAERANNVDAAMMRKDARIAELEVEAARTAELRRSVAGNLFDYRYGGNGEYAAGHDDGWDAAMGEVAAMLGIEDTD